MKKSKVKRIHINKHRIGSNRKGKTDLPVITIKQGSSNTYCNELEILGPSKIIYAGPGDSKPLLSCGARVVIETEADLNIVQ